MLLADTLTVIGIATVSLGTIHEADGVCEHDFWLRNDGKEQVTLVQGYTSCGCTSIAFDKDQSVAPGDSVCITLRFNPRGKGGEFEETGTVVYTSQPTAPPTSRKRQRLSLTGTCITSEETLLKQFPIRISDCLRLSTDHFDLGRMNIGESKERNVVILHREAGIDRQERIKIKFVADPKTGKGLLHIPYPITTSDNGKAIELKIRLDVFVR